jgi:acyl-coenzyme A thioesterase PaaI-like protein
MNASAVAHAGGVDTASTAGWGAEQSRLITSGPLTAVGNVVKAGSRIGFTDGQVIDASGKLVATATSTLLTFELPSPAQDSSTNGQHS